MMGRVAFALRRLLTLLALSAALLGPGPWLAPAVAAHADCCQEGACCRAGGGESCCAPEPGTPFRPLLSEGCGCGAHGVAGLELRGPQPMVQAVGVEHAPSDAPVARALRADPAPDSLPAGPEPPPPRRA